MPDPSPESHEPAADKSEKTPAPETTSEARLAPPPQRPSGLILQIDGDHRWTWVPPSSLRAPAGFGKWLADVVECAAIDALVITQGKISVKSGVSFHLEVPGDPPRYIEFTFEERTEAPAPIAKTKGEISALLLRSCSRTAHPVLIKESCLLDGERMKGRLEEQPPTAPPSPPPSSGDSKDGGTAP